MLPSSSGSILKERNQSEASTDCFNPFLLWLTLQPWRWKQHFPPKGRSTSNGQQSVISQNKEIFITICVRTSNPTSQCWWISYAPCRLTYFTDVAWVHEIHFWRGSGSEWVESTPVTRKGWLKNKILSQTTPANWQFFLFRPRGGPINTCETRLNCHP
jgi:hypothetical protein